ncbi:Protein of unknown function, partial [Gryllus bimaculatus]
WHARKGRYWLINEVLATDYAQDIFRTSLKSLLLCLDDPRPLQALMVRYADLAPTASIEFSAHAANVPVVLSLNNTSRGYVHVISVVSGELNPYELVRNLTTYKSINPQGIFIILHSYFDMNYEKVRLIQVLFVLRFGIERLVHLLPYKTAVVLFSTGYDPIARKWSVLGKSVPTFCKEQLDERTKKLQLNTAVENVRGFKFGFALQEQITWVDRGGNQRIGGHDYEFAKLLQKLGMVGKFIKGPPEQELRDDKV